MLSDRHASFYREVRRKPPRTLVCGSTVLPQEGEAMSGTRRKPGLLGAHVEGYRCWLTQRGYASSTVRNMLKDFGQVGRWLAAEELEPSQLDEERV